jgi:hypothetical protein
MATTGNSCLPSIDASYQVPVYLADGFQRRKLKCEKLTDDRQQTTEAKSSHCLWQGELKRMLISSRSVNKRGHHGQSLFLIGSFLKKKLLHCSKKIGQSETRIACGGHVC